MSWETGAAGVSREGPAPGAPPQHAGPELRVAGAGTARQAGTGQLPALPLTRCRQVQLQSPGVGGCTGEAVAVPGSRAAGLPSVCLLSVAATHAGHGQLTKERLFLALVTWPGGSGLQEAASRREPVGQHESQEEWPGPRPLKDTPLTNFLRALPPKGSTPFPQCHSRGPGLQVGTFLQTVALPLCSWPQHSPTHSPQRSPGEAGCCDAGSAQVSGVAATPGPWGTALALRRNGSLSPQAPGEPRRLSSRPWPRARRLQGCRAGLQVPREGCRRAGIPGAAPRVPVHALGQGLLAAKPPQARPPLGAVTQQNVSFSL